MGWFDTRSSVSSSSHGHVRRRSPSRRSVYSSYHARSSAPSLLGGGGGGSHRGRSSPSIFSTSSSSRRARPRAGFVQRVIRYIRNLLRDLYDYARRHPVKVFMMVIVPLVTSGVLQRLMRMIGVPLPRKIFGGGGGNGGHGHGHGGGDGLKDQIMSFMNVAKMLL